MCDKRKRGHNFTLEEKQTLLRFFINHKSTILNKKTDAAANEAKLAAWTEVTDAYNASGSSFRSKESLMKLWEKLKSESKKYNSSRRSYPQTDMKIDPILEQVCDIMNSTCTGIINDSENIAAIKEETNAACLRNTEHDIDITVIQCDPLISESANCFAETWKLSEHQDAEEPDSAENVMSVAPQTTPLWCRRRLTQSSSNEHSQAMGSLCSSYKDINKKKECVEDFKHILLKEELEFKRKLYEMQLKSAEKDIILKDLEIKIKQAEIEKMLGGDHFTNNYSIKTEP